MKVSHHATQRMLERANINRKNQKQFFRGALNRGLSYGQVNDEILKNYLKSIESSGCKAKLYKGYIFIHSKNSKQLYTMYKVPDKLLAKENNNE